MTQPFLKSVCQAAVGLSLTALAAQGAAHPFDGAERTASRDMRSPVRPVRPGDWRMGPPGVSVLVTSATSELFLQAPARTNISRSVKQPAASGLTVVPMIGCSAEDYIAPMTIGNSSTFQVIVDSGSTSAAVAGQACRTCNVSSKYTPGKTADDTGASIQAQ